jgi:hypothetical protein
MNWFERHLNWSLVLGLFYIPFNIGFTIGFLIGIFILIFGLIAHGFGQELMYYLVSIEGSIGEMGRLVLGIIALLLDLGAVIWVTLWYLGKKGRSGWFVLLLIAPPVLGLASTFFLGITGVIIAFGGPIIGLIILLLLANQTLGYGGAFEGELITERWPDTGQYGDYYDRQTKELEYRDVKEVKEIKDVSVGSEAVPAEAPVEAVGEAPAEAKVTERTVAWESPKMPILLDDTGAVIRCFYHPGADAVNSCSRCGQYVCAECNYVTGTHPICRNCWEKRGESPIVAAPPKKQKSVEPDKSEKQKSAGLGKLEKQEAEKNKWLQEFRLLYEQAFPIISVVIRKGADGMPASPLDLMEGLKLQPMLERAKKLSKPKDKELQEAKKEFEQALSSCIKVANAAAQFISGGDQALPGAADVTHAAAGIETASELMGKLSQKLPSFSQPTEFSQSQEDSQSQEFSQPPEQPYI